MGRKENNSAATYGHTAFEEVKEPGRARLKKASASARCAAASAPNRAIVGTRRPCIAAERHAKCERGLCGGAAAGEARGRWPREGFVSFRGLQSFPPSPCAVRRVQGASPREFYRTPSIVYTQRAHERTRAPAPYCARSGEAAADADWGMGGGDSGRKPSLLFSGPRCVHRCGPRSRAVAVRACIGRGCGERARGRESARLQSEGKRAGVRGARLGFCGADRQAGERESERGERAAGGRVPRARRRRGAVLRGCVSLPRGYGQAERKTKKGKEERAAAAADTLFFSSFSLSCLFIRAIPTRRTHKLLARRHLSGSEAAKPRQKDVHCIYIRAMDGLSEKSYHRTLSALWSIRWEPFLCHTHSHTQNIPGPCTTAERTAAHQRGTIHQ